MSIDEGLLAATNASHVSNENTTSKAWYMRLISPLWLCLLIALVLRAWLIFHTNGMIDGDEALVGIQAERILQGNFPVYFYGIPYFGSLEAYLAAPFVALLGPSTYALRLEATLVSLVLVWLTYRLASFLADAAHLPTYAHRCFTLVAGLVAAIPPLYDGIIELRTWGGYIETYVLMLFLLLSAFRLTRRWREGASTRELLWRWAGIGFVIGVGMWVYPLIIDAIVAAALWIVLDRVIAFVQKYKELASNNDRATEAFRHTLQPLLPIWSAIPASLLGAVPAIGWGATHHWANVAYIRQLGGTWNAERLHVIHQVFNMYVSCVAPRIISGALPRESAFMQLLHTPLLLVGTLCIFGMAGLVVASFIWRRPWLLTVRQLAGFPTLFAICAAIIYCTGSASAFSLISCGLDLAGRYASPIMLAFPFFFATLVCLPIIFLATRDHTSVHASVGTRFITSWFPRRSTKNDAIEQGEHQDAMKRVPTTPARLSRAWFLQAALFVLLFGYLGTQVWTYGISDPNYDFQSPYCAYIPQNYDPIIAYMRQQHIRYAWATNLLGHPIIYKTDSEIIVVDPLELMNPPLAINRIPSYSDAVAHADRASFIVFVQHNNLHPLLLRLLDSDGVTYRVARFPSEGRIDVMVVTPLSRTVSPVNWRYLKAFNCFTT